MRLWPRFSKFKPFRTNRHKQRLVRPLTAALIFGSVGSALAIFSFAQNNNVYIAPNPTIVSQSCLGGLNIALLADTSGSINDDERSDMKAALKDFVSSLLPSTNTAFSLTKFGGDATVVQAFTSDVSILRGAIDGLAVMPNGTNWKAGLEAAYSTFANGQPNKSNLLIIATDGNPTQPASSALPDAIDSANFIKAVNVHILALGIGDELSVENLEAISGPNINTGGVNADVITADFSTVGSALQDVAQSSCSSGSGGGGIGTGGNGAGNGGTGNGNGTGGTGTGTGGTGAGTGGGGTGAVGTGTGNSTGTKPQPSPTPVPTAPKSTQPSPAPMETPNPQPTPAPIAIETPEPQPEPAPTPTAQGTQTKPPDPPPSPFFDGKQYAPGSTPDDFAVASSPRKSYGWLYAIPVVLVLAVSGFLVWRKHNTSRKTHTKGKSKAAK